MAFPTLKKQPSLLQMRQQSAANDPRLTQITAETNNAMSALAVDEAEKTLEEKNAFAAAQNAALLARGSRPVGGGTYAELRRRKMGSKGMVMSGLGAANRGRLSELRRTQIGTQAAGAKAQVMREHALTPEGKPIAGSILGSQSRQRPGYTQARVGPVSGAIYAV